MENPKIRFKGFTKDWEQRKLGDVCSRVQGNDGRMKLPTLTISAGNGWMRQEDRFSGNIAGNEQKNYTLLHTGELSYNHGNSKLAKYGAVFSLRNYEEALVPRVYHSFRVEEGCADYIEYYFATKLPDRELRKLISSGARMDGLLNIGYDEFMGIKMMFPSIKEQNEIATYFRSLDHLITLHQRKCEQTKKLKKYMLQKMFPQNGAKVPEIRFDGFTYDWEQRKLSELLEKYEDPVETPHDGYERVGIRSHAKGTFHSFVEPGKELDTAKMYRVAADKFILNITFAWEHAVAITDNNDAGKLVSHRFPQFSFNPKLKPHFFKYLMLDKKFREHLELSSPGGAGRNRVLKISDMLKYEIKFPSIEEQIKIGEYFDSLDNLITLHQRKCDELKKMKKYMLQNMFI